MPQCLRWFYDLLMYLIGLLFSTNMTETEVTGSILISVKEKQQLAALYVPNVSKSISLLLRHIRFCWIRFTSGYQIIIQEKSYSFMNNSKTNLVRHGTRSWNLPNEIRIFASDFHSDLLLRSSNFYFSESMIWLIQFLKLSRYLCNIVVHQNRKNKIEVANLQKLIESNQVTI